MLKFLLFVVMLVIIITVAARNNVDFGKLFVKHRSTQSHDGSKKYNGENELWVWQKS